MPDPWPHAPRHYFTPHGHYLLTAGTLHKARLFDSLAKLEQSPPAPPPGWVPAGGTVALPRDPANSAAAVPWELSQAEVFISRNLDFQRAAGTEKFSSWNEACRDEGEASGINAKTSFYLRLLSYLFSDVNFALNKYSICSLYGLPGALPSAHLPAVAALKKTPFPSEAPSGIPAANLKSMTEPTVSLLHLASMIDAKQSKLERTTTPFIRRQIVAELDSLVRRFQLEYQLTFVEPAYAESEAA
jgi:hypothetical protein